MHGLGGSVQMIPPLCIEPELYLIFVYWVDYDSYLIFPLAFLIQLAFYVIWFLFWLFKKFIESKL
jgi:hypothetical protein